MNNLQIAQSLAFEPRKAFAEIADRPRFWFPFLALLVATLVTTIWYLSVVDVGWMMDQQIRMSRGGRNMSEEEIARTVQFMGSNPGVIMALGIVQVATLQSYLGSEHPYTQLDWSQVAAFSKLGLDPNVDMQADEDLSAAMEAAMGMLQ